MRVSNYTVKAPGAEGTMLIYNTATGAFREADAAVMSCLETGTGPLAGELEGEGFLTELTCEEEIEAQHAIFEAQRNDLSQLDLVIAPTYACNFRCPYCYELGHNSIKGIMSPQVQDALMHFVENRYSVHAFQSLNVQWYGGDPSLALDVVQGLSERLIDFCEKRDVGYSAMMLTNCNLIDRAAVEMLVKMKVESVFITIDGFEETHNRRRVSATGSNSFDKNVEAAKLFSEHGVKVYANMNVDRVNWPEFEPLRAYLRDEAGVELSCGRLCDYGHFYGTRDFCKPEFDLFNHDEFSKLAYEAYAAENHSAEDTAALMRPVSRFCRGQRNNYFVIDTVGDVYLCDGYIGEQDRVVGNIVTGDVDCARISHSPYESKQCRACEILPICQGNCDWERRRTGMICHPLRDLMPEYLRELQRASKR